MKLKGFYQDRKAQPCELDGVTFYVKPLSKTQLEVTRSVQGAGSPDFLGPLAKASFAREHIDGWENLEYDNGDSVPFTRQNAIELMIKDEYDGLCFALFDFAYTKAAELEKKTVKDADSAGKS